MHCDNAPLHCAAMVPYGFCAQNVSFSNYVFNAKCNYIGVCSKSFNDSHMYLPIPWVVKVVGTRAVNVI